MKHHRPDQELAHQDPFYDRFLPGGADVAKVGSCQCACRSTPMAGTSLFLGSQRWLMVSLVLFWTGMMLGLDRPHPSAQTSRGQRNPSGPLAAEHVAVVINSDDPLSEAIGTYYQQARQIPPEQVLRIRFPAHRSDLDPARFMAIRRHLLRHTPPRVQVYALAWAKPYRVGCQSITSAFSLGLHASLCADGCQPTALSRYYARGDIARPWDGLRIRPSMLLASTSAEHAKALIDRGVAADGSAPRGTVYLMSTSDGKRNARFAEYIRAEKLNNPDLRMQLIKGDVLEKAMDVLGYFTGLIQVPAITTNRYLPGAIADHLTSFGGQLTDSPQMSALRWLEAGATASYGTVLEPCNFAAKFPDPGLLFTYYRRGDSLIESYWRSVAMPGQGVFIGEPLARPWPRRPPKPIRTDVSVGASAKHAQ